MLNNKIVGLEQKIVEDINNSQVPISVTCLILEKLLKEANSALQKTLVEEQRHCTTDSHPTNNE